MSKTAAVLLAVVVVLAGIVGIIALNSDDEAFPTNRSETALEQPAGSQTKSGNGSETKSNESAAKDTVEIKDFAFNPATITVKKGTKVTWTNQDTAKHDVTPDKESNDFKGSELLAKGEKYEFIFNKTGTYTYHCTPHPHMKGTVIVTE